MLSYLQFNNKWTYMQSWHLPSIFSLVVCTDIYDYINLQSYVDYSRLNTQECTILARKCEWMLLLGSCHANAVHKS
jgi:hypothetical protein